MIKLEHVVLASPEQMKFIIEGMRNPMNSWEKRIAGMVVIADSVLDLALLALNGAVIPLDMY